MELDRSGVTRWVFLLWRWAIKFPSLHSWRLFLTGLLANIDEANLWEWSSCRNWEGPARHRLCPVLHRGPMGLWLVMERVEHVGREEDRDLIPYETLPAIGDSKPDNWGWLRGRWVCLDYASRR